MLAIAVFLLGHWFLSVFCQTFFLHRYGAHSMFTMSKRWERFFHLLTFAAQGSSYLNPRAYAILHREHHAYSDTDKDPHSPHVYPNLFTMMGHTLTRYQAFSHRQIDARGPLRSAHPGVARARSHRPQLGVACGVHGPVHRVLRRIRAALGVFSAAAGALLDGPNPRRDRELVRAQVRLSQFRHHTVRQVPQYAGVRFRDDGRAVSEQPPQVRHVAEFCRTLVRNRPDVSDYQVLAWLRIIDLGPAPQWARYPVRDADAMA